MIPDNPVLKRLPNRSIFSGSSYDPFYFITKNSTRLKETPPHDMLANLRFHMTEVHERSHWFQQTGTTYGAFLHALRASQSITFLRFFREETRKKRSAIFDDRIANGTPFIKLKPSNNYVDFEQQEGSNIGLLKQIWFDHQWMNLTFDNSLATDGLGHPPVDAGSNIMADVILHCCDTWGIESCDFAAQGHVGARDWYFTADQHFTEARVRLPDGDHHLTSASLMECSASLNELQQYQNSVMKPLLEDAFDREFDQFIKYFVNSSYGLPLKLFLIASKKHASDRMTSPLTLNLIIFFAVNPPLPPRVLTCPSRPYGWSEIFPPIRFLLAINALEGIPKIVNPESSEEMHAFLDALVEVTSLPFSGRDKMPKRTAGLDQAYRNAKHNETGAIIDEELILASHYRLDSISDYMPLVANYSSCVTGELSRKYADYTIQLGPEYDHLDAPLEFLDANTVGFRGARAFGNNVVRSVSVANAVYDFACGVGDLCLKSLPNEVSSSQSMSSFVERSLRQSLVEVDNI